MLVLPLLLVLLAWFCLFGSGRSSVFLFDLRLFGASVLRVYITSPSQVISSLVNHGWL
jgi:hypothetical protein